jgi:hypothetical protein
MGRRASAAVHIEPAAHHLCIGKHHPQAAAAEQLDTLNTAVHLEATNPDHGLLHRPTTREALIIC